jgi:hypothetical protein
MIQNNLEQEEVEVDAVGVAVEEDVAIADALALIVMLKMTNPPAGGRRKTPEQRSIRKW